MAAPVFRGKALFFGFRTELLRDLAVQASNVIRNTWLYEQIRIKARWFEALFRVGQTIASTQ